MILTSNAKQDFFIWYGTGENYFNVTLQPIEQYANIIDWLDSVGIFINTMKEFTEGYSFSIYRDDESDIPIIQCPYQSRQSATESAIKLANEIYNNEKRN